VWNKNIETMEQNITAKGNKAIIGEYIEYKLGTKLWNRVKNNIGNVEHDCKWEQGKKRRNKLDLKKEQNYSILGTKV
jgi:hypothetical protein